MEWNSRTATEWDWDNLDKTVDFSGSDLGHDSSSKSSISASGDSVLREGIKKYSGGLSKDFSQKELDMGAPMIGLKRMYFEDVNQLSVDDTTKRSRANYESTRCQVEGCNLDLKMAKDYHRRHRICETHSKSPKILVAGMERRFCQQCSRFHELSEFDDKKRSCRRRLSDHNARRRRPQPDTIQFNSGRLSSSSYDGRSQMNIVLDKVPTSAANPMWESACKFKDTQGRECLIRPAKVGGIYGQMNFPTNVMPDATSMLQIRAEKVLSFEGNPPQVFNQALEESPFASDLDASPDFRRALSLLSTNALGLNKPEPTFLDPSMTENQTYIAHPVTHTELQNWAIVSGDQSHCEPRMPSNLHDNGTIHFQEFQLFKAQYDPGCFYSSHFN